MATYLPITLVGDSLGARHRHHNSLVNDAYQKKVPFQSIQDAPELTAVDRLFKIDLASRLGDLPFILANLKDVDMLYVSRALHSTWLLEPQYRNVINPSHLEEVLYPEMTKTAINKMNNWLHVHLKDTSRCLEFFQYYSEKNFDVALKFLWNCPEDVIANTIAKMLKYITPKRMKLLSEKCPKAVRTYFELMPRNKEIYYEYLQHEGHHYRCLTNLINTDSDLLLDIAEKYYNSNCCASFSSRITQVIMNKHKNRYVKKPELYAAWLLHLPTLAKCLNNDEIKDIVLRLARAEYLGVNFFSYKRVEPLIKRLSKDTREEFKKLVFVDKCIGEKVKDWPYDPPRSPNCEGELEQHVFTDKTFIPNGGCRPLYCAMSCRKMGTGRWNYYEQKTQLDMLFDKYRCISFKNTFAELSKQIPAESSVQTREYMMLVLVSKAGGNVEYVKDVLQLLVSRHNNEAENFRATIVRSLVKRAKVWQLPSDLWQLVLKFAHGLGLDGNKSDERCLEGVHAVILRNILLAEECSPKVFTAYINQFSTFAEYSLNQDEKRKVVEKLPFMLLESAKKQTKTIDAVVRFEAVMKVLNDYNLKMQHCPEFVPEISKVAHKDSEVCLNLLKQLYDSRIARKDLYRENFTFLQDNESYLNILRHDAQLLLNTDKFEKLASEKIKHDNFLRKLAIYFSENEGLAANYQQKIDKQIAKHVRADLCRSLAILAGSSLIKQILNVDSVTEKTADQKRLAVALRACGHLARPKMNLNALGWRKAGVKAVANQISICSANKIEEQIRELLNWPRAVKLAFLLAERIGKGAEILEEIVRIRPTVAFKITICHLKLHGETFNPKVWEIGKAVLERIDLSQPKYKHLRDRLTDLNNTPESLKADYGAAIYRALRKVSREDAMRILLDIEDHLPKADEAFFVEVIKDFFENELTSENPLINKYPDNMHSYLTIRMIAYYLLSCKSEEDQTQRMETVGYPFMSRMKTLFDKANETESRRVFSNYWNSFMYNLKNMNVFFDASYVSCLPVMQLVVEWLKETMPIVQYFDIYATMHLNMLYYKAIKQSVKQNEKIFSDKEKRNEIGVEIVGVIFGKYIAHEIIELKTEYFESVVEIYAKVLISYLSRVFDVCESFWTFVSSLLRGLLEERDRASLHLVEKVYMEHRHSLKAQKDDKISSLIKEIDEKQFKFFMHADSEDIFAECA